MDVIIQHIQKFIIYSQNNLLGLRLKYNHIKALQDLVDSKSVQHIDLSITNIS